MKNHHVKKRCRTETKSTNPYLHLTIDLYRYLARRTDSPFNKAILKRLCMSRTNKHPLSLSGIVRNMQGHRAEKIAVVVAPVTNDERLLTLPAGLKVAALKFTKTARDRIVKAGGEALTFDQLAMRSPTGSNTVLLRGRKSARRAVRYFGVPGAKRPSAKAKTRSEGRKFERARSK